ncbi:MAG TPA: methyl-accepting chemotaxis protein [Patescibacteria group bacterium]|nr:methyl-accepting chemotaxis protein [Patescibacteria group bacterium]
MMNNKRFPIIFQMTGMFVLATVLLLSVLAYTLYQYAGQAVATEIYSAKVNEATVRTMQIKSAHTEFTRALLGMRGFLFYTDGAQYEQEYRDNMKRSYELVKKYNSTFATPDPAAVAVENMLAEYLTLGDKIIAAHKAKEPDINSMLTAGRQLVQNIDNQFVLVGENQSKAINTDGFQLVSGVKTQSGLAMMAGAAITVLVLTMVIAYSRNLAGRINNLKGELTAVGTLDLTLVDRFPTRNDELGDMATTIIDMKQSLRVLVRQLQAHSFRITSSSDSLSAVVEESLPAMNTIAQSVSTISEGTTQSAENLNTISATLQELSASSEEMNAGAVVVNTHTQDAVKETQQGMTLLDKIVKENNKVEQVMADITGITVSLAQGSQDIKGIVSVIQGIAGQTNLLALNAAIEAARAGEAGRGFAVVAEEVRKLAEQSAVATKNIEGIIEEMGREIAIAVQAVETANIVVDEGTQATAQTYREFSQITEMLDKVQNGMDQIAQTVSAASQGTQSMVASIQNVSAVAQQTSASTQTVAAAVKQQLAGMEEVGSNAASMAALVVELDAVVTGFKV